MSRPLASILHDVIRHVQRYVGAGCSSELGELLAELYRALRLVEGMADELHEMAEEQERRKRVQEQDRG